MRSGMKVFLAFCTVAVAVVTVAGARETEQDTKYKWVDANEDCRDVCDIKKYICPCFIL